jgi:hypothetical protein
VLGLGVAPGEGDVCAAADAAQQAVGVLVQPLVTVATKVVLQVARAARVGHRPSAFARVMAASTTLTRACSTPATCMHTYSETYIRRILWDDLIIPEIQQQLDLRVDSSTATVTGGLQ